MVLAPGNVFSPAQTAPDRMRFNVAQMGDPALAPRLRTVLDASRA